MHSDRKREEKRREEKKKKKEEERKKRRMRKRRRREVQEIRYGMVWNFVWNLLGFVWILVLRFRIPLFV